MTPVEEPLRDVVARARASRGGSNQAIYEMVTRALVQRGIKGGMIVDVGCGTGSLLPFVQRLFGRYVGADVIRYEGLPEDREFIQVDLDSGNIPLPDGAADVVAAVETIEHLENPRAFFRELVRLVRPGGWLIVTTPNQLSALNILSLIVKRQHVHFQDVHYPTHLSALLEVDLRRIASDCGLADIAVEYSRSGRIPLTPRNHPRFFSRLFPRALSDNLLLIARKPDV